MKISSAHLIKNLYEKQALRWKQTFGTRYVEATVKGEEEHKRGFFERLKLLFVKSNKKRAVSQGKL